MKKSFLVVVFLVTAHFQVLSSPQVSPLAFYRFEGDALDETGHNPAMEVWSAAFQEGAHVLRRPFYTSTPIATIADLSYDSFTVGIDFMAEDFQPPHNSLLCGGLAFRWMTLDTDPTGELFLNFNNGDVSHRLGRVLMRKQWHTVVCTVDWPTKTAITYLDGMKLPVITLGFSQFNVIGTGREQEAKQFLFSNFGDETHFYGLVDNLRVFSRALSDAEVQDVFTPKLSIKMASGKLEVSWSVDLNGYQLQENARLGSGDEWAQSATPTIIGDQKVHIEGNITAPRFYRLAWPQL